MSVITYLKGVQHEMKEVKWPSRTHVAIFTVLVIAVSVVIAYYLGLFDLIFTKLLQWGITAL
ncbi:preprotein translocase subunit SecE [Candidatus Nomurabacteria bacterium RIFCSPLOWO2_01_FULL_36_10b]|uniref:Protein translocase subunit SecE n=1 Tax=Candidatus Nomurabacteria bacterium RIFCSPLOWO2_01_FULL_36_10b TaxID=1801766 RepID=A0A1F6WQN6_9BACT|nr:MAG: preprotein translocase subunit SecE [Candidatus Nomurabacteria bacterium RIFCSPLOWO2_01_FULL_36_10b]